MKLLQEHILWTGIDNHGNLLKIPVLPKRFTRQKRKKYVQLLLRHRLAALIAKEIIDEINRPSIIRELYNESISG